MEVSRLPGVFEGRLGPVSLKAVTLAPLATRVVWNIYIFYTGEFTMTQAGFCPE